MDEVVLEKKSFKWTQKQGQHKFYVNGKTDRLTDRQKTRRLPYFFGYKTEFFPIQNNPKDLDPSYKMDLDLLDCLGRVKLVL